MPESSSDFTRERPQSQGYEFFSNPESQEEIYEIGKKFAEYAWGQRIPNVGFMDRSARPAYLAFREYWHHTYRDEQLPGIYFLNPKGLTSEDEVIERGISGMPVGFEILLKNEKSGEEVELPSEARSRAEISRDFQESYKRLHEDKDKTFAVFDTCSHTGRAITPVLRALDEAGFKDVRVGLMANDSNFSDIRPDLVALPGEANQLCYPFHNDHMIEKTYSSATSVKSTIDENRETARRLRDEITRIMREQIAAHPEAIPLPMGALPMPGPKSSLD